MPLPAPALRPAPHPTREPSRPRVRRASTLAALVAALVGLLASLVGPGAFVAGAQVAPLPPGPKPELGPAPPGTKPTPPPKIAPELADVELDSTDYRAAKGRFDKVQSQLNAAVAARDAARGHLGTLAKRDVIFNANIDEAQRRVTLESKHLDVVVRNMQKLAVASYVTGQGNDPQIQGILDLSSATADTPGRTSTMVEAVRTRQSKDRRATLSRLKTARHDLTAATAFLLANRSDVAATTAEHDRQAAAAKRLSVELLLRAFDVENTRAMSMVVKTQFPLVVLDAYWKAAQSQPQCGITWWALAGIGETESGHGTSGGSKVAGNGDSEKPIRGIPLDGTNSTASIPDTDHGVLDGDPNFDRAVGPMQFIPSTYKGWARDGNGDGRADPNNMYDAAMSAAAYLCAGGPMRTDADMTRGFLSYNQSGYYAALVLSRAKTYGNELDLGVKPSSPATPPPPPPATPVAPGIAGAAPTTTTTSLPAP